MTNRWRGAATGLAGLVLLLGAACGGGDGMMGQGTTGSGPTMGPGGTGVTALVSMSPAGSSTSVSPSGVITMRFGYAMGWGMEQYVALHEGDVNGPLVPMSCLWSADRTTLTCTPHAPLKSRTQYTIHMGGGMLDANGRPIDMNQYGPHFGGQWLPSSMGGMHGGSPWNMMGSGWRHPSNGSYGMVFSFFTI